MIAVSLASRRQQKFVGIIQRTVNDRNLRRINTAGQPPIHHFMKMPQKAEASHIGTGMDFILMTDFRRRLIQGRHRRNRLCHGGLRRLLYPIGRTHDAHPQLLCKNELVSRLSLVIRIHMLRVNQPGDGKTVFHIRDGMPSRKNASRFHDHFRATPHDLSQNI